MVAFLGEDFYTIVIKTNIYNAKTEQFGGWGRVAWDRDLYSIPLALNKSRDLYSALDQGPTMDESMGGWGQIA